MDVVRSYVNTLADLVSNTQVTDVLGKNAGDKVFPIETETDIVRLTGFIGKPETAKKTRGD